MEYRFVHHWQYATGEEENKILEAAIALATQNKKENYLQELAAFIALHTSAEYTLIGLLSSDRQFIHTTAFLKDQQVLENLTYPLRGTPCDQVLTQRFCYYPVKVMNLFPDDADLQHLQIESYLGTILLSDANEPIGLVTLMDTKSIQNPAFAEHLILVLSSAIEEELLKAAKSYRPLPPGL